MTNNIRTKFENKNSLAKSLKNEAKIYQYLNYKSSVFPKLKYYGVIDEYNYLVTSFVGSSLDKIIVDFNRFIEISTQIIKCVKILHDNLLVHRDLKPSNILFNDDLNKIFLIDFGFTKRYIDDNNKHIPETKTNNIIGSLNFVSLNVHNNIQPSRRDDLESCVYIMMYLYFNRNLEWFNKKNINEIIELKQNIVDNTRVPIFIRNILSYVRQLTFDETPNYAHIVSLFKG